jgi:hypothetical protein
LLLKLFPPAHLLPPTAPHRPIHLYIKNVLLLSPPAYMPFHCPTYQRFK